MFAGTYIPLVLYLTILSAEPVIVPMYPASVTPSGIGILVAIIAAGGIPKANAYGISLPTFFYY